MSQTTTKNCLHLCGPTTRCPGCGAPCYIAEMPGKLCRECNLKPPVQTPLEQAIELFAARLEQGA